MSNDINLLVPQVREKIQQLLGLVEKTGLKIKITHTYRSFQEQQELYSRGRTKPGKIITNAKAGYSYHNYGLAADFVLLKNGKEIVWDVNADLNRNNKNDWQEIGQLAKSLGFEWGGDFKTIPDRPHIQMTFGLKINELLETHGDLKKVSAMVNKRVGDVVMVTKTSSQDIPSGWAKKSWEKVQKNVGLDGKPIMDGTNPQGNITREQLAVILDRLGLLK